MESNTITRKMYKEIKKYDKRQFEEFTKKIYLSGYTDGFEKGTNVNADIVLKTELVQLLEGIKGVGPKTKAKILQTYKQRRDVNES